MSNESDEAFKKLEEQYFGANMHESAEIARLPELLDGVRCFVDVGASLGQYSYFAAKALDGARFICVEADPYKAERLRQLADRWASETGNHFEVVEQAASDRDETITFFVPESHLSSGAFFPLSDDEGSWKTCEVPASRLDKILEDVEVDFIKLDVEGGEYRALVGAEQVLRRRSVRLLLEIAPWGDKERAHKPSDVLDLLAGFGYGFSIFEDHYLFEKGGSATGRRLRAALLGFVLDRPGLKRRVKGVFNRLRGRR